MKKTLLTTAILAATSISSVYATEAPQWNQVSLGVVAGTLKESGIDDIDLSGGSIEGSFLLNESLFLAGRFEASNGDTSVNGSKLDADIYRTTVGIGYRYGVNETTDIYAKGSALSYKIDATYRTAEADNTSNGVSIGAGVRSMITHNVELGASATYIKFNDDDLDDDTDKELSAFAAYHFDEKISAAIGYSKMDDVDFAELKGSYSF